MKNMAGKPNYVISDQQVIWTPMERMEHSNSDYDSFAIASRDSVVGFTDVVVPFCVDDHGEIECSLFVPQHLIHRMNNFRQIIKDLAEIRTSGENVYLKCFPKNFIETNIIPKDIQEGFIHFKYCVDNHKSNDVVTITIIDKMIVDTNIKNKTIDFPKPKTKFNCESLKVFPILMESGGFIMGVATKDVATLYATITDSTSLFIGNTNQKELNSLIRKVFPLFPIFSINIKNSEAEIFFKENIKQTVKDFLKEYEKPCVKIEYEFATNECVMTMVGHCITS